MSLIFHRPQAELGFDSEKQHFHEKTTIGYEKTTTSLKKKLLASFLTLRPPLLLFRSIETFIGQMKDEGNPWVDIITN